MSSPTIPNSWISFWDQPHSIYVNDRHFEAHYRDIADGLIKLLPRPDLRVVDFGCGEALHADRVAARASRLSLCESAATVRDHLRQRFAAVGNIEVLSPEELAARPAGSADVIVANSVLQYVPRDDLPNLLATWWRLLAPGGELIVGDIIPPDVSPLSDATALLRYAVGNGFLLAALMGLFRTAFSPYRKVRARLGIVTYREPEIIDVLRASGFSPRRLAENLEHNPRRMSFACTR
jgi:SAM-dependent methyltransferase